MANVTGSHIAETAINSGLIGTPYAKMDCQAFVEEILKRAGLNIINFRGSNHMWRELVYDRKKMTEETPVTGSLAFIVKNDGGEKARGYHDDMKNAAHVAVVLDPELVMESTKGGVQYGHCSRFSHWAKIKDVDYSVKGVDDDAGPRPSQKVKAYIDVIKDNIEELERFIYEYFG